MQIDNYLRHQRPGSDGVTEHGLQKFANQAFFLQKEYDRGWDKLIFVHFSCITRQFLRQNNKEH